MKRLTGAVLTVLMVGLATLACSGLAQAAPEDDYLYPAGALLSGTQTVYHDSSAGEGDYVFEFDGDERIEYRIDLDDAGVGEGILRIYEATKDVFPVYTGGLFIHNQVGNRVTPAQMLDSVDFVGLLTGHSVNGNKVTLDAQDTYMGVTVQKRYEIELIGKSLQIRARATGSRTHYTKNYAGFGWGWSENAANAERVIIPYMETMGTTMVNNSFFYQTFIDYTQSHASMIKKMAEPAAYVGGSSTQFMNSVYDYYKRLNDDTLNTADETGWVTVTSNVEDTFVLGTAPDSPYR
ncbi:hypothetical protein ACFL1X_14955, partial [Candidatus Hydrogenedentota bacterium]